MAGSDGDFRIINNHAKVSSNATVGLYISGASGDVGIGTDVPRGELEVSGNLVIGNELSFGGVPGQLFGNTRIIERRYTAAQPRTELLLFKGNDGDGGDTAPDRIRHIAAEHVFQTYNSSEKDFYGTGGILATADAKGNFPLCITAQQDPGIVVIGGNGDTAANRGVGTKLVVNGDIEFDGGGSFKLSGLEFSTSDAGYNIIRNVKDGATRRPLTFVHEVTSTSDSEFARFDVNGRFGLGTTSPTSNIHVYDTTPGDVDIMKLQSIGNNKQTNVLLYTNNGEGGIIRGFSNLENKTTGLALAVSNNNTITTCLNIVNTSNVGVGTPSPARQFHVVDHRNPALGQTGTMRVESISSNASIEFTTSGGSSNIYADTTGNVYIQPSQIGRATTHITSNVSVTGDLAVGGNIDFTKIAVGLSGAEASTDLEIGGGSIIGSNEVSRKTYSKTFTIGTGDAKNIQVLFGAGAFYAKVTTILRRTDGSTVGDVNTMVLEVQGGTGNESQPALDVALGSQTLFGGTNSYPWSPLVTVGQKGISITPYNIDSSRNYSYDLFIELTSACGGKVTKITRNLTVENRLDSGLGGQTDVATFNY